MLATPILILFVLFYDILQGDLYGMNIILSFLCPGRLLELGKAADLHELGYFEIDKKPLYLMQPLQTSYTHNALWHHSLIQLICGRGSFIIHKLKVNQLFEYKLYLQMISFLEYVGHF